MPSLSSIARSYFTGGKSGHADIYLVSMIVSILMSVWVIISDDLINNDGYDYLTMASAAMHYGPSIISAKLLWPLPAAIAATASVLHINLELAAYLLSTIAFIIIVTAFISITKELGGDRKTLIWSAITILTLPYMNEGRSEILRDHIYWASFLTAFLYILRHSTKPSWKNAIAWNGAILISGIFRTEGFVIMALLPFALLLNRNTPFKTRLLSIPQAHTLTAALIIVAVVGAATGTLTWSYEMALDRAAVILEHIHQVSSSIHGSLSEKADILRKALLEPHAKEFDMPAIIGIIALIIVGKTIKTLTPLHTLLLLTTRLHTRLNFRREHVQIMATLFLINLAILIGFVSYQYFLQARYTMALSFVLLLPIPFMLSNLFATWRKKPADQLLTARIFPIIAVALSIMCIDILTSFSPSRSYVTKAAAWFQDNAPAGRAVITNESSFPYYANRTLPPAKIYNFRRPPPDPASLPGYVMIWRHLFPEYATSHRDQKVEFAAIRLKKGRIPEDWGTWLEKRDGTLLAEFNNRRNDGIRIYKLDPPGPQSPVR